MPGSQKEKFSQIYNQCVEPIYRFIFLKVNSQEVAEDLASETFIKGWNAFQKNNSIENPRAFLYQIARNLITDYYRQRGRTSIVPADSVPVIDPKSDLIVENIFNNSDLERIRLALDNVKDEYKEVITLHYIEDFSIQEIAKTLNKQEGNVRVLLHRALNALKEEIGEREKVEVI